MPKTLLSQEVLLNRILIWKCGVRTEGQAVIKSSIEKNYEFIHFKSYFFIIALNKLRIYLQEYNKVVPNTREVIGTFLKSIPEIQTLRNLREHEDEYLKGKGKNRMKYEEDLAEKHHKQFSSLKVDPHVNLQFGTNIYIGGRLNVQRIIKDLELLDALEIKMPYSNK